MCVSVRVRVHEHDAQRARERGGRGASDWPPPRDRLSPERHEDRWLGAAQVSPVSPLYLCGGWCVMECMSHGLQSDGGIKEAGLPRHAKVP
eukprot:3959144-Prymnesium_polylepis.1